MDRLGKLTESEARLVGAETLTGVKKSERTLEEVSTNTVQILEKLTSDSRESRGTDYRDRIKEILHPSTSALD
jgi:hypothetical protein